MKRMKDKASVTSVLKKSNIKNTMYKEGLNKTS